SGTIEMVVISPPRSDRMIMTQFGRLIQASGADWSVADRLAALQPQHVAHGVAARRLARQELRGFQCPARIAVARAALVDQLHRLAQGAENDGVFADVVAGADGVNTDLLQRPLADKPLAPVSQFRLAHRFLNDPGELQGRAAGAVLLEAMVALDD